MNVLYTTSEQIRAVLGLGAIELPDALLTDLGVEDQLYLRLERVYSDHAALAAIIQNGGETAEQRATWRALVLFTAYEAACSLLPQFQMIVAKRITDGDADMHRFGPDNLAQFCDNIRGKRDEYITLLNPTYFSANAFSLIGVASPAFDPVTNEGGV